VDYTCSLHPGETGLINVYADFYSLPSQLTGFTRGVAATAKLTTGGMPNYTFTVSNSNLPASLKVTIVNNTQGPVLTGTPGQNDAGNFAFDLVCEDADGNNVSQTYLVPVSSLCPLTFTVCIKKRGSNMRYTIRFVSAFGLSLLFTATASAQGAFQ